MKTQMLEPGLKLAGKRNMLSVLLVDHSERFLPRMANYLMALGCDVSVAMTVQAGLDIAARTRPHVMVMDVHMRDLDGSEAIRRVRADHCLAAVPVIAMAAQTTESDRKRCLDAGATAYVSKLVEPESLAAIILAYARRSA
jgi:CheY-like chemotaxis protein